MIVVNAILWFSSAWCWKIRKIWYFRWAFLRKCCFSCSEDLFHCRLSFVVRLMFRVRVFIVWFYVSSHVIAELSTILAKYFPFLQLHVAVFQTKSFSHTWRLLHSYQHLSLFHDLHFFHQIYIYVCMIYALIML